MQIICQIELSANDKKILEEAGFIITVLPHALGIQCPGTKPHAHSHKCYVTCFGTHGLFTTQGVSDNPPCMSKNAVILDELIGLSPEIIARERMTNGIAS